MPSAEEYLAAVPTLLELGKQEAQSEQYRSISSPIFNAITIEIDTRYQPLWDKNPALLNRVYQRLVADNNYWEDRDVWVQAIVLAWINENTIDLAAFKQFQILDYSVRVSPRDFDADGKPEWWLHVKGSITQDIVVAGDKGGYELVESPLPWFGCCFMYSSTRSGFMEEQLFEDLNNDGLPEWIWAVGGYGANYTSAGYVYVLQWQEGKLVDLAPPGIDSYGISYIAPVGAAAPLFPKGVHIEYFDENGDDKKEIIIFQEQNDNWGCTWTQQRIFGWADSDYRFINQERSYNNVQGCAIRQAEEAMWTGDYQTAITQYERGLDLEPTEDFFFGDAEEIARYATARLALAYTLANRFTEAEEVIRELSTRVDDSATLVRFIDTIQAHLGNASAMCEAAYEVFTFECPSNTDACSGSPLNAVVGRTEENSGYDTGHPAQSFPSPLLAGCDPSIPLNDALEHSPLSANESITLQLEAQGLSILDSLQFDLNQDGVDEWLVWLTEPVPALFFYAEPHDAFFQFSYVQIPNARSYYLLTSEEDSDSNPNYDPDIEFNMYSTPDRKARLLINTLDEQYQGYFRYCPLQANPDGGYSQSAAKTSFTIWRLIDDKLQLGTQISFCDSTNLEAVFGKEGDSLPDEIKAWAQDIANGGDLAPATYTWNIDQQTYLVTHIETVPELPPNYSEAYGDAYRDAQKSILEKQDYQTALDILDLGLNNINLLDIERNSLAYLRAVALEALERPEEALAEYVTIYEAAPESAWGMLAGLHIEPTNKTG